jgi:hypothetical protein
MRSKYPESGFRALLPMTFFLYGVGLAVTALGLWPVGLWCLIFGTTLAGFGIWADYSDAKRKARGR